MRETYVFLQSQKNPYSKKLKKQITINLDGDTIDYFKSQSEVLRIPYQTLINLYLSDCVTHNRRSLLGDSFLPCGNT